MRSLFGLKTLTERVRKGQKKMLPWSPLFAARFTTGSVLLINNETIKRAWRARIQWWQTEGKTKTRASCKKGWYEWSSWLRKDEMSEAVHYPWDAGTVYAKFTCMIHSIQVQCARALSSVMFLCHSFSFPALSDNVSIFSPPSRVPLYSPTASKSPDRAMAPMISSPLRIRATHHLS